MSHADAVAFYRRHRYVPDGFDVREFMDSLSDEERSPLSTFDEMVERGGMVAALNSYFGAHGTLPAEKTRGEYHEALGDPGLGEDVELHIKSHFSH